MIANVPPSTAPVVVKLPTVAVPTALNVPPVNRALEALSKVKPDVALVIPSSLN